MKQKQFKDQTNQFQRKQHQLIIQKNNQNQLKKTSKKISKKIMATMTLLMKISKKIMAMMTLLMKNLQ